VVRISAPNFDPRQKLESVLRSYLSSKLIARFAAWTRDTAAPG